MKRALEVLLRDAMGLDAGSIGAPAMERAVHERMAASNRTTLDAYVELARGSEEELQQLIEAIVVPETWFLRDPQAFTLLARWALETWMPTHVHGTLRLLSLPCSTGEEPYSMAMTLLAAGFPADRVSIDAVDISECSLAMARRAVYGKNSFRGENLVFRGTFFEATAGAWHLRQSVQSHVRFHQANLLAADLLGGSERYDAIFCRNVLIYFDRETQDRTVGVLRRLLAPGGLVFVGPSETSLLLSHDFVAIKAPLAFAFQTRDATIVARRANTRMAGLHHARPPLRASAAVRAAPVKVDGPSTLQQAAALADAGSFAEAAALCAEHVARVGPAAEAFRLNAMIFAEAGNLDSAAENYRSALYLDPNDYESLIHLSLLLEKRGDAAGAKVLQKRAQRLEVRVKTGNTL
jgi:chemotaxis protein methyltransferase WspC